MVIPWLLLHILLTEAAPQVSTPLSRDQLLASVTLHDQKAWIVIECLAGASSSDIARRLNVILGPQAFSESHIKLICRQFNDGTRQRKRKRRRPPVEMPTNHSLSAEEMIKQREINARNSRISFVLMSVTTILLLLLVVVLVIAFVYESTLKNLFIMVEDDFLHNYSYDAFVSYNVKDADWIFEKLIPNLEGSLSDTSLPSTSSKKPPLPSSSTNHNEIKLCVYDRDFIAGRAISECITDAIKNSRKVILVISRNFVHRFVDSNMTRETNCIFACYSFHVLQSMV